MNKYRPIVYNNEHYDVSLNGQRMLIIPKPDYLVLIFRSGSLAFVNQISYCLMVPGGMEIHYLPSDMLLSVAMIESPCGQIYCIDRMVAAGEVSRFIHVLGKFPKLINDSFEKSQSQKATLGSTTSIGMRATTRLSQAKYSPTRTTLASRTLTKGFEPLLLTSNFSFHQHGTLKGFTLLSGMTNWTMIGIRLSQLSPPKLRLQILSPY